MQLHSSAPEQEPPAAKPSESFRISCSKSGRFIFEGLTEIRFIGLIALPMETAAHSAFDSCLDCQLGQQRIFALHKDATRGVALCQIPSPRERLPPMTVCSEHRLLLLPKALFAPRTIGQWLQGAVDGAKEWRDCFDVIWQLPFPS